MKDEACFEPFHSNATETNPCVSIIQKHYEAQIELCVLSAYNRKPKKSLVISVMYQVNFYFRFTGKAEASFKDKRFKKGCAFDKRIRSVKG